MGGGAEDFYGEDKSYQGIKGKRKDGKDLVAEWQEDNDSKNVRAAIVTNVVIFFFRY